jgi:hypothetical protein
MGNAMTKITAAADKLIALLDYEALSSNARLALIDLISVNEQAKHASPSADLIDVLHECEAYFDNRADADCDQDGFIPNEEMKLMSEVREAIAKATA